MRKLLVSTAILLIIFVAVGLFLPDIAKVERQVRIAAPLETVFAQVNDIDKHEAWNPWKLADPDLQFQFGQIRQGVGASYQWSSDGSGEGGLQIVESIPHSLIRTKLDFGSNGSGHGLWTFQLEEGLVELRWELELQAGNVVGRYSGLFIDKILGKQIQKGLDALRGQAERQAQAAQRPD